VLLREIPQLLCPRIAWGDSKRFGVLGVFFFVERADKGEQHALNLIIQSAYVGKRERSPRGRMAKKITFRALITKVLAGEKPKPPPWKSKPRK
jgi:hypothetical protein